MRMSIKKSSMLNATHCTPCMVMNNLTKQVHLLTKGDNEYHLTDELGKTVSFSRTSAPFIDSHYGTINEKEMSLDA